MSILSFLLKPRGLEQQRQECISRFEQAATNHELSNVICQATAESLQTTLDINKRVRESTRSKIEKMTKDCGSGEKKSVTCEETATKKCASCAFFRKNAEGLGGTCTHLKIMAVVSDVFFCDYWIKNGNG